MTAEIIDGKRISTQIKEEIAEEIKDLRKRGSSVPGLAVVLVGDDPASLIYVRNKKKACEATGIESSEYRMAHHTSQEDILKTIQWLNQDENIHGILVQLPLPKDIDTELILESINPEKDVDCFHPRNMGKLVANTADLVPCTSAGIIELLNRSDVKIKGKRAVILGRSNIVGKPTALMLLHRHATVTICHSRTEDIEEITREADILVAAIGVPKFVKGEMVKDGAVVIDVGMNRLDNKLAGDVDFDEVAKKASLITPVPGGVGPMTIALLMRNTLTAFKKQLGKENQM
ncbi:MAG: bifunctional methylenetetrahydrofolate dehydrogenase/methenyltetrahydrofolate cyclohydrolase FolD [Nitrospinota bacterium]